MFTQFVKTSRALKRYRNGPFAYRIGGMGG
jgi:hypothetical protein